MSGDPQLTRRAVLLGTLATVVAACTKRHRTSSVRPVTPDAAALRQAIADEEQLLVTLGRLAEIGDALVKEQGVHADHLIALRRALGQAGASPSPSATGPTQRQSSTSRNKRLLFREFDRQRASSARRLQSLSVSAARGSNAALLASIAACHTAPPAWDGVQLLGSQP